MSKAPEAPQSLQAVVDFWREHRNTPVIVIDETRRALYKSPHKEFIAFMALCIPAGQLYDLMADLAELKGGLQKVLLETLKGKDLLRLAEQVPEFKSFLDRLAAAAKFPARLFLVATTIKNIHDAEVTVSIRADRQTGRPPVVKGPELKVALNLLRRFPVALMEGSERVDVIIDRSAGLGLAPDQRKLAEGQSESFFGRLGDQGPLFNIISDSDEGVFADALLLPDFLGYLLLYNILDGTKPKLVQSEIDALMAPGGPPFRIREFPLPGAGADKAP